MKQLLLSLILLLSFSGYAQQLSGLIEYKELGLSFTIPDDWVGQEQDGYVLLGSNTTPGLMVLMPNESRSVDEMKNIAKQGIIDEGVQLSMTGEIATINNYRIEAGYTGLLNFEKVKCHAVGMINGKGSGLTILVITTDTQFGESQINAAKQLANSVQFYQASESKASGIWREQLQGRRLVYMNTVSSSDYDGGYSGSSTRKHFDLCSNGRFYYHYNSNSSFSAGSSNMGTLSGFGYANSNDSNEGTWKIMSYQTGSFLQLTFSNGNIAEYGLSENAKGNLLLDGTRYFRADAEGCGN